MKAEARHATSTLPSARDAPSNTSMLETPGSFTSMLSEMAPETANHAGIRIGVEIGLRLSPENLGLHNPQEIDAGSGFN